MFRTAIYCNVFLLFIMSIYFLVKVFSEESDLKNIRKLVIIYFILNIINGYTFRLTDIGWDGIKLFLVSAISFIIHIVAFCVIRKKLKQRLDNDFSPMTLKKFIVITLIPIIILVVPLAYELYIIKNCEYIITYNYQEAWINSEDTYIAIMNNEPVTVTLRKDILDREGRITREIYYDVVYNNDIKVKEGGYGGNIVENEDIKKIALDALEKCPSAKGATVNYFPEGKYAIIRLRDGEESGTVLGEYFYYENVYVQSISTHGDLDEIIYYE